MDTAERCSGGREAGGCGATFNMETPAGKDTSGTLTEQRELEMPASVSRRGAKDYLLKISNLSSVYAEEEGMYSFGKEKGGY